MNKKILIIAGIIILIFTVETSALVTIQDSMGSHIGNSTYNIISMSPGDHLRFTPIFTERKLSYLVYTSKLSTGFLMANY